MPAPAAVIVPTAGRPGYLDVALASLAPQVLAEGADLIVVDDGPSEQTRAAAARHGARYIAHRHGRGLNAARNTGIAATDAALICFVDDDVRVHDGWLAALLAADAREPDDVLVLTGPIVARFEDHHLNWCGREGPPITHLELGARDRDADYAWGANLTLRRGALDRAGAFDESRPLYGDEQEWQDRVREAGGRIRYIAAAGLDHRRAGDDARLASLCAAARSRGRASRRYDRDRGRAPALATELRVLAGCLLHGPRFRCANGPIMSAHTLGRLETAFAERLGGDAPPATPGVDDFLSGRSGLAQGRAASVLGAIDAMLDVRALAALPRRRAARTSVPRRRVLVLSVERTDVPGLLDEALDEIFRSHHQVTIARTPARPGVGKFQHLNEMLAGHDPGSFDWIVVLDDDVALPHRFLDTFLAAAEAGGLVLVQPAHRRRSHAAWKVTGRAAGSDWRETNFVEIGPVTAFAPPAIEVLLPFPAELQMGWGLDTHWSAVAAGRGWRIGVVDATPVAHTIRATADGYPREQAAAEARAFLSGRPYTTRAEVRTLSAHRFRWH